VDWPMAWWTWVLAGGVLLVLEVASMGLVLLFFGAAAMLVGLVLAAAPDLPPWGQLLAFSLLSVTSLLALRGPLLRRIRSRPQDGHRVDRLEDETAVALGDLAPGQTGQAELRGTPWKAYNADDVPLAAGTRCRVVKVDGLTLHVARPA
jgi:inner membrane protein